MAQQTPLQPRAPQWREFRREMVGPFVMGRLLGKGNTGRVYLGSHHETGEEVAVKVVQKDLLTPAELEAVNREVAILKLVEHPHVIRLLDMRESRQHLFLVTEVVKGGSLFDYSVEHGALPRRVCLRLLAQMLRALEHCQAFGICHRDLKPENVLLDADLNVKIGDFGFSRVVLGGRKCRTACGSPHYACPELLERSDYDGRLADVWSLGVIFYVLVTSYMPFFADTNAELFAQIRAGDYTFPPGVHPDLERLISRMLTVDPARRARVADLKRDRAFWSPDAPAPRLKRFQVAPAGPNPLFFPPGEGGCAAVAAAVRRARARPLASATALDEATLAQLLDLGFCDGDPARLRAGVLDPEPTVERIYYHMLLDRARRRHSRDAAAVALDSPRGAAMRRTLMPRAVRVPSARRLAGLAPSPGSAAPSPVRHRTVRSPFSAGRHFFDEERAAAAMARGESPAAVASSMQRPQTPSAARLGLGLGLSPAPAPGLRKVFPLRRRKSLSMLRRDSGGLAASPSPSPSASPAPARARRKRPSSAGMALPRARLLLRRARSVEELGVRRGGGGGGGGGLHSRASSVGSLAEEYQAAASAEAAAEADVTGPVPLRVAPLVSPLLQRTAAAERVRALLDGADSCLRVTVPAVEDGEIVAEPLSGTRAGDPRRPFSFSPAGGRRAAQHGARGGARAATPDPVARAAHLPVLRRACSASSVLKVEPRRMVGALRGAV